MANGYHEVKKHQPCLICGTADWCCRVPAEDGYGDVHICKRYTDPRVNAANPEGDVISYDGKLYVFLGVSRAGSGIYRPEDEVAEAEAHGFHVWRKGAHDVDAVQGKRQFKKELIPVGIVEEADDEKKDLAYRMLMSFYPLKASHRVWLEGDGWRDVFFDNSMLCSFPADDWMEYYHKKTSFDVLEANDLPSRSSVCAAIINELGSDALLGVPGFYLKKDKRTGEKYWYFEARSGIGFPLFNEKGQIVRIRVRMDFMDISKSYQKDDRGLYFISEDDNLKRYVSWKGVMKLNPDGTLEKETDKKYRCTGKYRGMSSFLQVDNVEAGTYTNLYECGTEGSNIVGLIKSKDSNPVMAILTEGEKKGIVGSTLLKVPFCILPGVNSYTKLFETRIGKNILEYLINSGVQFFAIAYDADRLTNINVLRSEKGLAMRLLREGLKPLIFTWDEKLGKGLDDALIKNAQLMATELTIDNIEEYYQKLGL